MLSLLFIILLCYVFLIGSFIYGFDKVVDYKLKDIAPKTTFTIVVPFRNEAENLPPLLKSLSKLNYPKSLYEIILVNDESTDDSLSCIEKERSILNSISLTILNNERQTSAPKKDAITTAIKQAKYQWIVTTDADCILPKYWLDGLDCYIQEHKVQMLVAPVTYGQANSFFERFQLLEILSLQGITIGGFGINKPLMCNGANFAYKTSLFEALNGFSGNTDIASGDDIFLLEKALSHDKKAVHYIKNPQLTVTTKPQTTWKAIVAQRVRWASKTSKYKRFLGKMTGFIVLVTNALLVCLPLLYVLQIISLKSLLYTFIVKSLIDLLLIFKSARFFGQEYSLPSYFFACIIYPFFNVYVAFLSVFSRYKWKDRAFTK
ncbi:glycosyltransferase family 2 protein [Psychroserpens sp. BH13MA-6]